MSTEVLEFVVCNNLLCESFVSGSRAANSNVSIGRAHEMLEASIAMWKPLISYHRIFELMETLPELQLSYLIEQTVFVRSAFSYLSLAARSAKNAQLKRVFSNFAEEERYHYKGLAKDLSLSSSDLERRDPAPGTQALLSYLHDLAYRNPRALLVISALFETSGDEVEQIRSFYGRTSESLIINLDRFVGHHLMDVELGHTALWKSVTIGKRTVSHSDLSDWIDRLHMAKHMIELWFDSMIAESGRKTRHQDLKAVDLIRPKPTADSIYVG